MSISRVCSTCAFWQPASSVADKGGTCHFNPPTPFLQDGYTEGVWPPTSSTAWCGKHQISEAARQLAVNYETPDHDTLEPNR